jgi:preprotein translocase SecE subunit
MDPKSHYSFGVFKYGQGYWVRMMTAILAGILVLSCAAWAWGQLTTITIPTPRWDYSISQVEGAATPGQSVQLRRLEGPIGTAAVEEYTTSGRNASVRVGTIELTGEARPLDVKQIEVRNPDGTRAFFGAVTSARGIPVFNLVYLQAGVAGLIVLLGGWLIYWMVGHKPEPVEFLIATDAEMKKVNWGTRKVILDSTWVVIGATFIIAGVLFAADTAFSLLFRKIGVLGTGG